MPSPARLAGENRALFSGAVNWSLIREHYDLFMQLSVAIQSGAHDILARLDYE
jgi:hypothetical protein